MGNHVYALYMIKGGYIYILASQKNGTLYTGVTSDLAERIQQHKDHAVEGFTAKYDVTILVYYEWLDAIEDAIVREKQIKKWKRLYKLNAINALNPQWLDLSDEI